MILLRPIRETLENDQEPNIEVALGSHELIALREKIDGVEHDRVLREVTRYTERSDRRAFIANKNNKPVGYVEVVETEEPPAGIQTDLSDFGHLARIGVIKEGRGQGIGGKLLVEAETWLQKQGAKGVWTERKETNEASGHLFQGAGYKNTETFQGKDGTRRVLMIKEF